MISQTKNTSYSKFNVSSDTKSGSYQTKKIYETKTKAKAISYTPDVPKIELLMQSVKDYNKFWVTFKEYCTDVFPKEEFASEENASLLAILSDSSRFFTLVSKENFENRSCPDTRALFPGTPLKITPS